MNLVTQFIRIITKILERYILYYALPFLDNIIVKGLQIVYNGEKSLLGVYRYILEYIIQLDRVLIDLERARYIILDTKSYFYKDKIIVVSYHYNRKGQYLEELKVAKIIYQKDYKDITLARVFLGVCVYYQIQVEDFAIKVELIFQLL